MKVFLDDQRDTPPGWFRTYDVNTTIALLKAENVTDLSLDHDLGDGELEGIAVLNWIESEVFHNPYYYPPSITIHSDNPVGRQNMKLALDSISRILARREK